LTDASGGLTIRRMTDDELDPRETARNQRRDRDAEAEQRELMRPGMGKVFKQILDRQARDAEPAAGPRRPKRAAGASKRG
jgi:hypothetical protein